VQTFLRDRVFGGAKQSIERKAIEKSRQGSVRINQIGESQDSTAQAPKVTVRVERTEVVQVTLPSEELMEEFLRELRRQ
jgi:hypothetical protein